jgi:hypothetical protein
VRLRLEGKPRIAGVAGLVSEVEPRAIEPAVVDNTCTTESISHSFETIPLFLRKKWQTRKKKSTHLTSVP